VIVAGNRSANVQKNVKFGPASPAPEADRWCARSAFPHAGMWLALTVAEGNNMRIALLIACALTAGSLHAQSNRPVSADASVLTTVRIITPVKAGGTPLPTGTYELRLTGEYPAPAANEQRHEQEWVEFASNGKVVARELAEIQYDDDLPAVGASSEKARNGTRVEMLKDGEFLRISVKRGENRYLIYLPVNTG
jgi:hypothetical protein